MFSRLQMSFLRLCLPVVLLSATSVMVFAQYGATMPAPQGGNPVYIAQSPQFQHQQPGPQPVISPQGQPGSQPYTGMPNPGVPNSMAVSNNIPQNIPQQYGNPQLPGTMMPQPTNNGFNPVTPNSANPNSVNPNSGIAQQETVAGTPVGGGFITRPLGVGPGGAATPNTPMSAPTAQAMTPPVAPFTLTPQEQGQLYQFLAAWQQKSSQLTELRCEFIQHEYDGVFSQETKKPTYSAFGKIQYQAPDKGLISTDGVYINDKPITDENNPNVKARKQKFVCNGENIYYFNFNDQKLEVFPIPPEQRGKGTIDSPLLAIVGASPQSLNERFYLRLIPQDKIKGSIIIEAWPKWAEDVKDFKSVQIMLDAQTFDVQGFQKYHSNGVGRSSYAIQNAQKRNGLLDRILPEKDPFAHQNILKSTPRGWEFIEGESPLGQAIASQPQSTNTPSQLGQSGQPMMQPQPQPAQTQPGYANPMTSPTTTNPTGYQHPGTGMPGVRMAPGTGAYQPTPMANPQGQMTNGNPYPQQNVAIANASPLGFNNMPQSTIPQAALQNGTGNPVNGSANGVTSNPNAAPGNYQQPPQMSMPNPHVTPNSVWR